MTTCAPTSNDKFCLELERTEGRLPVIKLAATAEVNVFDVAQAIYRDCYVGDLGFNIRGLEAICFIKTYKSSYKFLISEPHNFEDMLMQVSKQMSI